MTRADAVRCPRYRTWLRSWNQRVMMAPGDHRNQQYEPRPPVQQHQSHRGEHHGQGARGQCCDATVEEFPQRFGIGGLPGDDSARGVALVKLQVEQLGVAEQAGAQVQQHGLAGTGRQSNSLRGKPPTDDRDGKVAERGSHRRSGVVVDERGDARVDTVGDEGRAGSQGSLRDTYDERQHDEPTALRPHQGTQQTQRGAKPYLIGGAHGATSPAWSRYSSPNAVST